MARFGEAGIDLSSVKEEDLNKGGRRKLLPDGWYRMMLAKDELKPSKKTKGGLVLHATFRILDPGHEGELREFLTVKHPNAETVQIAKAALKALAIAVGHPNPDRIMASDELFTKPFMGRVYTQEGKGDQQDNNRIGAYLSLDAYREQEGGEDVGPAATQPPQGEEPPPPSDDDIPF